jgi:hypothetical protein
MSWQIVDVYKEEKNMETMWQGNFVQSQIKLIWAFSACLCKNSHNKLGE